MLDRRLPFRGESLCVGAGLALGLILFTLAALYFGERNLEEAAFDNQTKSLFATFRGVRIHCADLRTMPDCSAGYKNTSTAPIVLWLGNSQLHAVNQLKPDDETSALLLHRALRPRGQYLTVFSQPNANLQEHYVVYAWAVTQLPVRTLILPLVFDDLRETGVRKNLAEMLDDPQAAALVSSSRIGRDLAQMRHKARESETETAQTTLAWAEDSLNAALSEIFSPWEKRPQLRGELFYNLLALRNWGLNIRPSSLRKVIPANKTRNMSAFETLLADAQQRNINVLTYVAPIRDDVPLPYETRAYRKFKKEARAVSEQYGARFLNLEGVVPSQYWGTTQSLLGGKGAIDYMHFQAGGHKILADHLLETFTAGELNDL